MESIRRAILFIFSLCVLVAFGRSLLPIVFGNGARENAKRAHCMSNLREIRAAMKLYWADYNGRFPVAKTGKSSTVPYGWFKSLTLSDWAFGTYPYVKDISIFQCPNEEPLIGTDYYLNTAVAGGIKAKFPHSDNTVLLTEGPDTASLATASAPLRTGSSPPFARHLDGANYCFIDGHVKWLQSSRAAADSGVAASGGGFTFGT